MKRGLVELGKITRAHGFKGGFVVAGHGGTESALGYLKKLFIGNSPGEAQSFDVIEAAWMPKGWKLCVAGIVSDTQVKSLRGSLVFADRANLTEPKEGQFYVTDLIGADVVDAESEQVIGTFSGVEAGTSGCGDRWWIQSVGDNALFPVPATKRYIEKVDVASQRLTLRNLAELNLNDDEVPDDGLGSDDEP